MDKEIEAIIKSVPKEVWLELYDNSMKGPLTQFGKFGEQLVKTLRLATYPIQYAAHKQDMIDLRFAKAIEAIPEGRRIIPADSLVLEIADKLRYHPSDNLISELYVDLLSASMDSDRVQKAHPAFIYLIGQISFDEALLILLMSENKQSVYVRKVSDWNVVSQEEREGYFGETTIIMTNDEITLKEISLKPESFYYPENFYTYIDHLNDLGLIKYSNEPHSLNRERIKNLKGGDYDFWFLELSRFGELFFECCSRGLMSSAK